MLDLTLTRSMVSKGVRRALKEGRPERASIGRRSGVEKVCTIGALEARMEGAGEVLDAEVLAILARVDSRPALLFLDCAVFT